MLSNDVEKILNEQIVHELYSSYTYLAIACDADRRGLKVLSSFFFMQSEEERAHAMKVLHYILEVNGTVKIGAVPAPPSKFASMEAAVAAALKQEEEISGRINKIMDLATAKKDYPTVSFLKWFIDEQVEEESSIGDLLKLVKLAGPDNLLMVEDRLLRTGASPSSPAAS